MTSEEIRERFLEFFEERGHLRIPSASLVPSAHDPSALLTVAGMHPLKPYFLGREAPPAPRLTSCQKCFRTVDVENVGNTNRHLTFFEMLGNFSIGDYFKADAIELAWKLSLEVFGFEANDIWVTVFEGDEQLGLGADEEAIELWRARGVAAERIVRCPRSENFWQAGPTGPCGPCSELYLDRGAHIGEPGDLPGGENERFLEYWNLVFMQYDQREPDLLVELPARNIDTGLGLNRMAAILQEKRSVFETDQFWPLIELGQDLSGAVYGESFEVDRALRILADHARAMTFLIADGVVPSNEERGYVLRRVMRRAIQQARTLEMQPGFLVRYSVRVRELMWDAYPELDEQRVAIEKWLSSEEEGFGRTLEQGMGVLRLHVDHARDGGLDRIAAEDAFKLHDTFGFPFELTQELLAAEGLAVDEAGFDELMEQQRARARAAGRDAAVGDGAIDEREQARTFAERSGQTRFTGYETERQPTSVAATERLGSEAGGDGEQAVDVAGTSIGGGSGTGDGDGDRSGEGDDGGSGGARAGERLLVKLTDSPFYPAGGGQVSDGGTIECEHGDCVARVQEVFRLGDDQVLSVALERGTLNEREPVVARVDHLARRATERNHTATHLLHAALRERLGTHVRQAGSYVGPDKLRFDFSHSSALGADELHDVEERVNEWIGRGESVHAITTTLEEARRLGAMALFGEKYGEIVRMVEIGEGEHSRELCGGTHVRNTAEIGAFVVTAETSSAANVRRIEALTGPAAVSLLRARAELLERAARALRTSAERVPDVVAEREATRRAIEKAAGTRAERVPALLGGLADGEPGRASADMATTVERLAGEAQQIDGVLFVGGQVHVPDPKLLLQIADRVKGKLSGDGVIVLGAAVEGRASLVVSVAPALVKRGVRAGAIVKQAAQIVGGGGGGRDTMAQAGGRNPEKLDEALAKARTLLEQALRGDGGQRAGGGAGGGETPGSEGK
jgi:alanyl-tRNA synthetase